MLILEYAPMGDLNSYLCGARSGLYANTQAVHYQELVRMATEVVGACCAIAALEASFILLYVQVHRSLLDENVLSHINNLVKYCFLHFNRPPAWISSFHILPLYR